MDTPGKVSAGRAGIVAAVALVLACAGPPEFDLVIRGGDVYDGSSQPPQRADVGIKGDRITAVGNLADRRAGQIIDAVKKAVAPGFIDARGRSGITLLADGTGESHIRQGITSEIIGEAISPAFWTMGTADVEGLRRLGLQFDWNGAEGYFRKLEDHGTSINVGTFVPAAMAWNESIGRPERAATPEERGRMEAWVDEGMRGGGFGLSSASIDPSGRFVDRETLTSLARVASRHGGVYAAQISRTGSQVDEALQEAIRIGREAKLPVVIHDLNVEGRRNRGAMPRIRSIIIEAVARGEDVSGIQSPYTAVSRSLDAVLPGWAREGGRDRMLLRLKDPAARARMKKDAEALADGQDNLVAAAGFEGIEIAKVPSDTDQTVVGKRVSEAAAARREGPWDTVFRLLLETGGRVDALFHLVSEDDIRTAMQYGRVMFGTGTAAARPGGEVDQTRSSPAAYGTFPRVLGRYVRELKVLELAEAVRRMTSLPALELKIARRGYLRPGYFADVVVFDPQVVGDRATYDKLDEYPVGIDYVIVNGVMTVTPKGHTGARAGRRLLRSAQ
jgi:N-acyl-D-aspartate/D-glutamate deacylase